jgi:hypothetical protein
MTSVAVADKGIGGITMLEEIKEALEDVSYPEHEFRGHCYDLLSLVEKYERALKEIKANTAYTFVEDIVDRALGKENR